MVSPQKIGPVLTSFEGPVTTITLNRPDQLNAINAETDEAMQAAFEAAYAAPQCQVIVLTGAGRGFCSGAQRSPGTNGAQSVRWAQRPDTLDRFRFNYLLDSPKPVIAALNGPAIGVGLVIACYCDIRLAVDDAKLSFPYSRLGLVAEYGIAKILPTLIGASRAYELLLSGRQFDAKQGQAMGLISQTASREDFSNMVQRYVKMLAQECSPVALRAIKRQLRSACRQELLEAIQQAGEELSEVRQSHDYAEAIEARRERRAPIFTGR